MLLLLQKPIISLHLLVSRALCYVQSSTYTHTKNRNVWLRASNVGQTPGPRITAETLAGLCAISGAHVLLAGYVLARTGMEINMNAMHTRPPKRLLNMQSTDDHTRTYWYNVRACSAAAEFNGQNRTLTNGNNINRSK